MRGSWSADGWIGLAGGDLLSYLRAEPGLTLVAYSPLLKGAYVRADRPLGAEFDHPGTAARLAVLDPSRLRWGRRLTRWCWRGCWVGRFRWFR
jgi:hypothetical protein